jgi:hypothetical protein
MMKLNVGGDANNGSERDFWDYRDFRDTRPFK